MARVPSTSIRPSSAVSYTHLDVYKRQPPYFHYCAAWALVHGAVALYHSPFWSNVLEDQEGFFQFLMDIGVRMGNKRKRD